MDATVAEVRTLLARAFVDDPLMVWFFPDDQSRLQALLPQLSNSHKGAHVFPHRRCIGCPERVAQDARFHGEEGLVARRDRCVVEDQ